MVALLSRLALLLILGLASTTRADAPKYETLVADGNAAATAYNCTKAEDLYQQALEAKPNGVEALVGSASCMAKQSNWTAAHARFDKALQINPKYEPALWGKAEAYRLAYKTDDAIEAYRKYLAVFPNTAKAKQALEKLKPGASAIRPVEKVVKNPKRTQDVTIAITGTKIVANGVEISGRAMLADWIGVYGKPDRTWDTKQGVNKIHTWDRLGLLVYEPVGNPGRATTITLAFKATGMAYDPRTMFGGTLTLDGQPLAVTTELATVKTRPGATLPYGVSSVVFPRGDFNVFTTAKTTALDLVEINLWKNDKAPPVAGGGGKYSRTQDVKIQIAGNAVTMNGVAIGGKPYLKDIEAIYGKPDRTWDSGGPMGNRVHTWDRLGIVVYEPKDGRCVSTTFPYRTVSPNFDPQTWFGGSISVDGHALTASTELATVRRLPGAGQPYGADSVLFDRGDIHVFAQAKSGTLDLIEISYWQRDKAPVRSGKPTGNLTAANLRVEVSSSGMVKLQGTEIGARPMIADLKKLLGEPDRVWDKKGGANRIHIWDALGVIVYEPHNGRATTMTMPYRDMKTEFSPKTMFTGRIALDGRGIFKFNTIGVLKQRPGATQPYGDDVLVFDLGEVHLYTKAPKPTVETIDLVELNFWQTK